MHPNVFCKLNKTLSRLYPVNKQKQNKKKPLGSFLNPGFFNPGSKTWGKPKEIY
jgi:hypothetical protein